MLHLLFFALVNAAPSSPPEELVIYTYDSMLSKGGFAEKVFLKFEALTGCKIKALAAGDGVQIVSRLEIDFRTKTPEASIVLGIDQNLWERMKPLAEDWKNWRPNDYQKLKKEIQMPAGFLPFDYGVFALMADTEQLAKLKISPPKNLRDLLAAQMKKNFILEDPRTSPPGLAFLLFTKSVLHENVWNFWKALSSQWLTLSSSWDHAYGLFLKSEAPVVWSYTTSEAYHRHHGDKNFRYRSIVFDEGAPLQIEGAAIVKGRNSKQLQLAQKFLDFLLSAKTQAEIPRTQWMFPSRDGIALPEEFKTLPAPKKWDRIISTDAEIKANLKSWSRAISEVK